MSLINRAEVRRLILERAPLVRPGWACTRVSGAALEQIETGLRVKIDRMLAEHPSIGQTFLGQ